MCVIPSATAPSSCQTRLTRPAGAVHPKNVRISARCAMASLPPSSISSRVKSASNSRWLGHAASADDQYLVGPQMNGRRDGCRLPHRTIAEIGWSVRAPQRRRRKHEGDGRAGQQVIDREGARLSHPLVSHPGLDGLSASVEGDMLATGVVRCRHRQRLQVTIGQIALQLRPVDLAFEQTPQGLIVQQRPWAKALVGQDPADAQHRHPARAGGDHVRDLGAVDLLGMEVRPHLDQPVDPVTEVMGTAGQHRRVDGASRRAADDRKKISGALTVLTGQIGNGGEHTHLVGRPRTTTGQQQAGGGGREGCRWGHGTGFTDRAEG